MPTDKELLQVLADGKPLSNTALAILSRKGLIKVDDVTNSDTQPGQRDLMFTGIITERGRRVLEGE
jgi:hypothetical protein